MTHSHPYYKEVSTIIQTLINHKCGFDKPGVQVIQDILAVDEYTLSVHTPDGTKRMLIVLGNEPGVAIADYQVCPVFDTVCEEVEQQMEQYVQKLSTRVNDLVDKIKMIVDNGSTTAGCKYNQVRQVIRDAPSDFRLLMQ